MALSQRDQLLFGKLIRVTFELIVSPADKQRRLLSKISLLFLLQQLKEGSGIMRKITERQLEALKAIEKHIKDKGFPPSYRELMKELSLKSTSSVKGLLDALRRKEYVTWEEGLPRTLKVVK